VSKKIDLTALFTFIFQSPTRAYPWESATLHGLGSNRIDAAANHATYSSISSCPPESSQPHLRSIEGMIQEGIYVVLSNYKFYERVGGVPQG
jgi:hypothetical protein